MVAVHYYHHARQTDDDPLAEPTGDGISGAYTIDDSPDDPSETALGVDTSVPVVADTYTVPLVATDSAPNINIPASSSSSSSASGKPTATATASSGAADATQTAKSNAASSDDASGGIPLGATIGICVGALCGALFVVLIGLYLYKRSTPSSRRSGGHAAHDRAPSQSWKKLDESGDTWASQHNGGGAGGGYGQNQQMHQVSRSQDTTATGNTDLKLNMFKKSNSQRTAYTSRTATTERMMLEHDEPVAFAAYHPALAEQMASSEDVSTPSTLHPVAPFARTNAPESWLSASSYTSSLRPTHVEGSMSPSVNMAIPTPSVVSGGDAPEHQWHSAQVVEYGVYEGYEGQSAEIVDNPFEDSHHSPSPSSSQQNERERHVSRADPVLGADDEHNPFSDENMEMPLPPMPATMKAKEARYISAASMASETSNGRAIQSLIAALHEPEQRERKSMQPSVISEYTDGGEGVETPRTGQFDYYYQEQHQHQSR